MREAQKKIAMVGYLNSKPFEFGIKNHTFASQFEILKTDPATCSSLFNEHQVDISLIPVGAIHQLEVQPKIITDYCIGCDGDVRTVVLFANNPIESCRRLIADHHSRTSVLLAQILLEEVFNIVLPVETTSIEQYVPKKDDLLLMIGDKVFENEGKFLFKIDLGALWKTHTCLPFVFAVWVCHESLAPSVITMLNDSFSYGVEHIDRMIDQQDIGYMDLREYYTRNISYHMDEHKKKALALFLEKSRPYFEAVHTGDDPLDSQNQFVFNPS